MRAMDFAIGILILIASTTAVVWLTPAYNNGQGLSTGNSTSESALTAQYQLSSTSALYTAVVNSGGYDPLTYLYQMVLGSLTMFFGVLWIYFQFIPFAESVFGFPSQLAAIVQVVLYFAALLGVVQFLRGVFLKPME
jgi:hypothetical protein